MYAAKAGQTVKAVSSKAKRCHIAEASAQSGVNSLIDRYELFTRIVRPLVSHSTRRFHFNSISVAYHRVGIFLIQLKSSNHDLN